MCLSDLANGRRELRQWRWWWWLETDRLLAVFQTTSRQ